MRQLSIHLFTVRQKGVSHVAPEEQEDRQEDDTCRIGNWVRTDHQLPSDKERTIKWRI